MSLFIPYSAPERDFDMESRVRAVLKQYDELLDICWVEYVFYNQRHNTFEGRYAVIAKWPVGDARWKLYQSGEVGSSYDILGWFAENVQDASVPSDPELVMSRVMTLLANADNTKSDWKVRMRQVIEKNRNLRATNRADFLNNEIHDIASYERQRALGNAIVGVKSDLT